MLRIVLDTNVIVSAALSSQGNPAKIIRCVGMRDDVELYYNLVILAEYKKVLAYGRLNIRREEQEKALAFIRRIGIAIIPAPSDIAMPDESDRIFYDTAKACEAYLITGNKRHYPDEPFIYTPSQFVTFMGDEK